MYLRFFLLCFLSLSLTACGGLMGNSSKTEALSMASKRLKCPKKGLKHRVLKGGAGKFGLSAPRFYAVAGCKKRTCIKCTDDCKIYERDTKDKCPGGLVR